MKKLLLGLIAIVLLMSCEDDLLTYNVEAHLTKDITADIESSDLKNSVYSFEVTDTLNLEDVDALQDYLNRIREINIKESKCVFTGLPSGETITDFTIVAEAVGMDISFLDVFENNAIANLDLAQDIIDAIGSQLLDQNMLVVTISGKSSFAPMQLGVKLDFFADVTTALSE